LILTFDISDLNVDPALSPTLGDKFWWIFCTFLLLVRYVSNVAKRRVWDQRNIED